MILGNLMKGNMCLASKNFKAGVETIAQWQGTCPEFQFSILGEGGVKNKDIKYYCMPILSICDSK